MTGKSKNGNHTESQTLEDIPNQIGLSALEEDILSAIRNKRLYSLEIISAIASVSNHRRTIGSSSIYPTLRRMEEKGYVDACWGDETPEELATRKGARRRYYIASPKGKQLLDDTLDYRQKLVYGNTPEVQQLLHRLSEFRQNDSQKTKSRELVHTS